MRVSYQLNDPIVAKDGVEDLQRPAADHRLRSIVRAGRAALPAPVVRDHAGCGARVDSRDHVGVGDVAGARMPGAGEAQHDGSEEDVPHERCRGLFHNHDTAGTVRRMQPRCQQYCVGAYVVGARAAPVARDGRVDVQGGREECVPCENILEPTGLCESDCSE